MSNFWSKPIIHALIFAAKRKKFAGRVEIVNATANNRKQKVSLMKRSKVDLI